MTSLTLDENRTILVPCSTTMRKSTNTPTTWYANASVSHSDRELTPIHLQPSFPELTLPPLGDIPFTDRGHFADAKKANLYAEAAAQGGSVKHYTPVLGVEFKGVSLKQLSKQALDDLALLIAERGVVGMSLQFGLQGTAVNPHSPYSIQEAR